MKKNTLLLLFTFIIGSLWSSPLYQYDFKVPCSLISDITNNGDIFNNDGYSGSIDNNSHLLINTDGGQLGYSTAPLVIYDKNTCSNKSIDLQVENNRYIKVRVKSTVDVPQFMILLSDGLKVADQNTDIHSLKAEEWTDLIFDVSDPKISSGGNIDISKITHICMYSRQSWGDNIVGTTDPNAAQNGQSISGTIEFESINIGPVNQYFFDFTPECNLISNITSQTDIFNNEGYDGFMNEGNLNVNTTGVQLGYSTAPLSIYNNLCNQISVDLTDPNCRYIKVRVKSTVDVPQFMILLSDGLKVADQNADIHSLKAEEWTDLIFDVSDPNVSGGGNINMSKITNICMYARKSWGDNIIGTTDPNAAQNGESVTGTIEIEYLQLGIKGSIITNISNNNINVQLDKYIIYPNPASSYIRIKLPSNNEIIKAQLITYSGLLIKTFNGDNRELNINDVPRGTYLLEVVNRSEKIIEKIIIE